MPTAESLALARVAGASPLLEDAKRVLEVSGTVGFADPSDTYLIRDWLPSVAPATQHGFARIRVGPGDLNPRDQTEPLAWAARPEQVGSFGLVSRRASDRELTGANQEVIAGGATPLLCLQATESLVTVVEGAPLPEDALEVLGPSAGGDQRDLCPFVAGLGAVMLDRPPREVEIRQEVFRLSLADRATEGIGDSSRARFRIEAGVHNGSPPRLAEGIQDTADT